ncbi:hypothetical protein [uncultured Amphritea sp.]|uniref:hypothetical protein n=1 Tax=uncultured Amphritea sp. TaxID=981605 RepID=UPI00260B4880|nr:hypothetical protein [uncultured Amphritea sp.]
MNNRQVAPAMGMAQQLLNTVRKQVPVVDRVLTSSGDCSVSEYLQQICEVSQQSYQSRSDVAEVMYEYIAPLLGEQMAERAAADFLQHPVALTTNHHGVDFFAQSVQGSLLFGLAKRQIEGVTTIPVFSCANIPLDNITYPRGALLYGCDSNGANWPLRVPLFSNKLRRQPVARVKGLDRSMIQQAAKRVRGMVEKALNPVLFETLLNLLESEYLAEDVVSQKRYSAQSVILNQRIWTRLFCSSATMPDLVTIELEKLAEGLLLKDLQHDNSLASVLFAGPLITTLFQRLDTISGCWSRTLLEQRWADRHSAEPLKTSACGTFGFWGVDSRFRRIPLMLSERLGQPILLGCDDNGEEYHYSLEPTALSQALRDGRLMPSVFSCFLVIALARGVTCLGGYYQAEYLPQMQTGVAEVLQQHDLAELAVQISASVTDSYLSGMQAIMVAEADTLLPAGLVEILSSGAITAAELELIANINLRDAHYASLAETVADVMPTGQLGDHWLKPLMIDQWDLLSAKVALRRLS